MDIKKALYLSRIVPRRVLQDYADIEGMLYPYSTDPALKKELLDKAKTWAETSPMCLKTALQKVIAEHRP